MRIDAKRKEDRNFQVYHAEMCQILNYVVWVDDETHQYAAYSGNPVSIPHRIFRGEEPVTHQAKRILIRHELRLIVINPLEDSELQDQSENASSGARS